MSPLVLAALLLAGAGIAKARRGRLRLPSRASPFLPLLARAERKHGIPVRILAAWITRESNWKPREYNPESAATMLAWSCEIADKPHRWANNPDYSKAVEVCRRLRAGDVASLVAPLWTFGSAGLMQVSRISASESGGLPYDAPNDRLLDPAVNVAVGARVIAKRRERFYPGRTRLTDDEWGRVRAAYVGGPGILTQRPERAMEIARLFLDTLREQDG